MTTRILPADEWDRLAGTDTGPMLPFLDRARDVIVVLEEEGAIVGAAVKLTVTHWEGAWIAPSHRGARGMRRLIRGLVGVTEAPWVVSLALTRRTARRWRRMGGFRWPGWAFVVPTERIRQICLHWRASASVSAPR